MYRGLLVKYSKFFLDFNQNWIFSTHFHKILKYEISWKSVEWEPSYSIRIDGQMDRRTHITKVIVAFLNFAKALIKFGEQLLPLSSEVCDLPSPTEDSNEQHFW